jgi:hypothetical protein
METPNQQPEINELQAQLRDQQHQIRALAQALTSTRQPIPSRFNRIRRLGLGGTLALCLALMLGTVALAAIPGAGGVITACYTPRLNVLRLIDVQNGQKCFRSEQQITWNQVGPQGIPGTPGLKGDTGPQGPQGVPGTGISGYEVAYAESSFDSSAHKALTVDCPAGKTVLGGGGEAYANGLDPNRNSAPIVVRDNEPYYNGWGIIADEFGPYDSNWLVRVYAICANVG